MDIAPRIHLISKVLWWIRGAISTLQTYRVSRSHALRGNACMDAPRPAKVVKPKTY
ncbi:hypothetical protein THIOM_004689 [Candidatus Thiomargarita nelsonii]|uniref:Uncharacterized protein n=1 Tax=Candidatus Thiomargarita nelsonii TaxID=1003181 RepID=A0A176RVC0_9GAMM|nr:hypothetical protein THIOM_004689 [Candidatus Thiomargarita nelsonii]